MIHLGLLALLLTATPVPAPAPSSGLATEVVKQHCLAAVNDDRTAEAACLAAIMEHAEPMRVDELDPKFTTSCLVIPEMAPTDLIWSYLEWLEEHPDAGEKSAAMTINAALLEKVPCGWRQQ